MTTVTEIIDVDLNHWVSGTRLFRTDDDTYFVILSDMTDYPTTGSIRFIRRATSVMFCTAQATVDEMTPDHTFPAGTTPEDVIAQLGYTLEEQ